MNASYFFTEHSPMRFIGRDKDGIFVWNRPVQETMIAAHALGPKEGIIDGKGRTISGDDFWDLIGSCRSWDRSQTGRGMG